MSWLFITLTAYFLNAIAMVIDKSLLRREIKNPFVYTFYVAALGAVLIILAIPFAYLFKLQLIWPGWGQFCFSLLAGGAFSIGLFLMFIGLKREDASRLTPMIGGLTPIFVALLAYFFIGESLSQRQLLAFILIVAGTFLISLEFNRQHGILSWFRQTIAGRRQEFDLPRLRQALWWALPAAIFFSISYVMTKDVYNHQPFISGFVWTRLGAFILVLVPILFKANRQALLHPPKNKDVAQTRGRFLFGQACGGTSAVLIQYAISIASVSLVQALQGVQYVFVFLGVLFLTYYFPRLLKEDMGRGILVQKVIAILLIALGLYYII